jgi:hypothetical protein
MIKEMIKFSTLLKQTRQMAAQFEKIEQRSWGVEGIMIELSKQVGDLAKRVMVAEKYYLKSREQDPAYRVSKEKLADELFGIWYCLVRLADYYQLDFEEAIDRITRLELLKFKLGKTK